MSAAESTSRVCVGCGYDLAGRTLGEACSECGETIVQSPFRGAWRDVQARGRFVLGAGVLVLAGAIDVLRQGVQFWRSFSGFDAGWLGLSSLAFTVCLLAAIILLGLAARRIAVVWLLVIALAIRLLAEVAMDYVPPVINLSVPREFLTGLTITWTVATTGVCLLPLVIARSAGRPSRRTALWCVCLIGALGSSYFGLTLGAPELMLPVHKLIGMIPNVSSESVLMLSIVIGAVYTTLAYLLLALGVRGARR